MVQPGNDPWLNLALFLSSMNAISVHTCSSSAAFRAQLNDLIHEAFGFTFERWQALGVWNEDYTCYSIIEDGRMLSNACVYRMDLQVNGRRQEWLQIGAVATRTDQRGKGLSRKILDFILERYPDTPSFLCANESVLSFYPRFGYTPIRDRQPILRRRLNAAPGRMNKLTVDHPKVGAYLERRACFSNLLDCTNAAPIHWFHLLYEFPDAIYEIPALQVMLVAGRKGNCLALHDVVAGAPLFLDDLLPYLDFPGVDTLQFGFNPDWLCTDYEMRAYPEDSAIFVRGELRVEREFMLPGMIKT